MEIVEVPINELIPADYNPRQLTEKQHEDLKRSMKEFGFVDPVIVNQHPERKNVIVGGHMRCRIAMDLGHQFAPCVYVNLDIEKEKELNIRLNKNTGEWDFDELSTHFDIEDLTDWGFEDFELDGGPMGADGADGADGDSGEGGEKCPECGQKIKG